jgi:hypothetical protein
MIVGWRAVARRALLPRVMRMRFLAPSHCGASDVCVRLPNLFATLSKQALNPKGTTP